MADGLRGCGLRQGLALVAEELQRQTGIELGIIHPAAFETPVLIVLDEPVVGVAGKGERAGIRRRVSLRGMRRRRRQAPRQGQEERGGPEKVYRPPRPLGLHRLRGAGVRRLPLSRLREAVV